MRRAFLHACIVAAVFAGVARGVEAPLVIPDGTSAATDPQTTMGRVFINGQQGGVIILQGQGKLVIQGQVFNGPGVGAPPIVIQGGMVQGGVMELQPGQIQQAVPAQVQAVPVQVNPVVGQAQAGQAQAVTVQGQSGPVPAAAGQAQLSDTEQAIQKFLLSKGGDLAGNRATVATPELAAMFEGWTFVTLTIPQWPVARVPQKPLAMTNIFATDPKGNVTQMTTADQLEQFFKDHLPALKGDDLLKAASAWIALTTEFSQDGMFHFIPGKPDRGAIIDATVARVSVEAIVDPAGGNSGSVVAGLTFDEKTGKLTGVKETRTVKAGMRPICQSTKLLDPDPLVRRMAEQDLLIMGKDCFWYLDMMREKSSPELQKAIDDIKVRILKGERITPRTE